MNTYLKAGKILNGLNFDFATFTMESFLRAAGRAKGREILTIPWEMPSTLFGAWMTDGDEAKEYIFYRNNISEIHQIHIQLHELSHFLFEHPTLRINRKIIAEVFAGKTSLPFADLPQLRSPKQANAEIEAETLTNLILERVGSNVGLDQLSRSISLDDGFSDFVKTMGLI